MTTAKITSVFVRPRYAAPMLEVFSCAAEADYGLIGDAHKSVFSPRHVHLVSRSTLDRHRLVAGTLNENLTIDGLDVDTLRTGDTICVGDTVRLQVTFSNETCNVVQPEIRDGRGVHAIVLVGGTITKGDRLHIIDVPNTTELPNNRWALFQRLLSSIPAGRVVKYTDVVFALAGNTAHVRIIPSFLKRAFLLGMPAHRIVDSAGHLIPQHLPDQRRLLHEEGIVDLSDTDGMHWSPSINIYRQSDFADT